MCSSDIIFFLFRNLDDYKFYGDLEETPFITRIYYTSNSTKQFILVSSLSSFAKQFHSLAFSIFQEVPVVKMRRQSQQGICRLFRKISGGLAKSNNFEVFAFLWSMDQWLEESELVLDKF